MIVDQELLNRVEDAMVAERSVFADGMSALRPDLGASWLDVAGGRAIFTGAGFFSNRAMGLGLHAPVSPEDIERLEAFYAERGAPSEIEIASTVGRPLIQLLNQRGYRLTRFRNIYAQALRGRETAGGEPDETLAAVDTQEVDASMTSEWSGILLDGFGYTDDADRQRVALWNRMLRSRPEVVAVIAAIDGQSVGSASVMILGTTAVLGGATTLPAFRRRGVQRALIEARLSLASRTGCELAIITADPASSSGRNAERSGFQLVCNHAGMRKSDE